MLGGGAGPLLSRLAKHDALALAHGIENEGDESLFGETDAGALVILGCFAFLIMTAGLHYRRAARSGGFRPVQVGGDVIVGAALEDDFLDYVIVMGDLAGVPWVERGALRECADTGDHHAANFFLQLG